MNPVTWLQSVLPETVAISGWGVFVFAVGGLILGGIAVAGCIRSRQLSRALDKADRSTEHWRQVWFDEISREDLPTNSPGPQVTAKTLREEE